MPIYEYRCDKGHEFEVIGKFTDDPLEACEVCGASVVKVLHPPAIHFKGSGFHNTDYGTKKRNAEKAAQEKAKKETASSSTEGKSDSKSSGDSKKSETKKSDSKSSSATKKSD